ncbi:hypothetical protein P280DRAFT_42158 [Massarina eburnea CBS 473.64]|uniref:Uncharacterized protein n=1 Tax=Massarina eburnea CBS 473.64 TaxID=1395130 RepID=A0A6A6RZK2_9PLEO|nr:hypothetical protein P280DRAFT_42158 [Massarina eburnea CBS 473.64]
MQVEETCDGEQRRNLSRTLDVSTTTTPALLETLLADLANRCPSHPIPNSRQNAMIPTLEYWSGAYHGVRPGVMKLCEALLLFNCSLLRHLQIPRGSEFQQIRCRWQAGNVDANSKIPPPAPLSAATTQRSLKQEGLYAGRYAARRRVRS